MHIFKEKNNKGKKILKQIWRNKVHIYKILLDSTCILKYYVVLTNFYNFLSVLTLAREITFICGWIDPCGPINQQQRKYVSRTTFLGL